MELSWMYLMYSGVSNATPSSSLIQPAQSGTLLPTLAVMISGHVSAIPPFVQPPLWLESRIGFSAQPQASPEHPRTALDLQHHCLAPLGPHGSPRNRKNGCRCSYAGSMGHRRQPARQARGQGCGCAGEALVAHPPPCTVDHEHGHAILSISKGSVGV